MNPSKDQDKQISEDSDLEVLEEISRNLEAQLEILSSMKLEDTETPAVIVEEPPQDDIKTSEGSSRYGRTTLALSLLWFFIAFVFAVIIAPKTGNSPGGENDATNDATSESNSSPSPPVDPNPSASPPVTKKSTTANDRFSSWQVCRNNAYIDAATPQSGEVWWPVVGPPESLAAAKTYCRSDAYINKTGNAQIASFRDRAVAAEFAAALAGNTSPPYRFWVGDPSHH